MATRKSSKTDKAAAARKEVLEADVRRAPNQIGRAHV